MRSFFVRGRFCAPWHWASLASIWTAALIAGMSTAQAVTIELKAAAPKRVENQRAHANGAKVLPGTPDLSAFSQRLTAKGQKVGNPVFLRIFKAEAELEVWMRKNDQSPYELFATYPVCNWSGTLGPKLAEGDKQTPEGFYTLTRRQLHRIGRWPRSLNLGFPNVYDRSLARTGSYILVHGGCSSVGCFAMTNPVIEEIYRLTRAAIYRGQRHVPVHVFPFRMTEANLKKHAGNEWIGFWHNLKEGHDAFHATRIPPRVRVCDGRYHFDRIAPREVGAQSPLKPCGANARRSRGFGRILLSCTPPPGAQQDQLPDAQAGVEKGGKRRAAAPGRGVRNLPGRHAIARSSRRGERQAAAGPTSPSAHAGPDAGRIVSVQMQPDAP